MKATVFIATSFDGFIARQNGDVDWLEGHAEGDWEDNGYGQFIDTVDAIVMGRKFYEMVLNSGQWPYGTKPVIVLSSRPIDIPDNMPESIEAMSGSPKEIVTKLSERGVEHIYVDGGKTIQGFLDAGLIQRLIVTRIPVLIGSGLPLFGPLSQDIKLRHINTEQFASGLVQSEYEVLP